MDLRLGVDPSMDIEREELSPSGDEVSTREESLYTLSQSTPTSICAKDLAILSFLDFQQKDVYGADR